MRDILSGLAPLVIPTAVSLLALALATFVAGICTRKQPLRGFLLGTSLAFIVILFVFGWFGVAVTLMTIKEAVVAGGS